MAGLALGVGRGMGEVGMSLLLGGNLIGKTDTLSLAIYNAVLDGDFASAEKFAFILAALALDLAKEPSADEEAIFILGSE